MKTEARLKAEIERDPALLADKAWRLQSLYPIRTKGAELANLDFNEVQRRMAASAQGPGPLRLYYVKARQLGLSTFWLLWHLDTAIFERNKLVAILSHSRESLGYLTEVLRLAVDRMPPFIKPRLGEDSKTALSFPDSNSRIFVSLSVRSTAAHAVHISEFAFADPLEVEATLAAATPDADVTCETTGNGLNHAWTAWQEAQQGVGKFTGYFYPWFLAKEYRVPLNGLEIQRTHEEMALAERAVREHQVILDNEQILWRRVTKKELKRLFEREYPESPEQAFITPGISQFFDVRKVQVLLREADEQPPVEETEDYTIWEPPQPKHRYAAGADPAQGGADYSVLSVLCLDCRVQAFRFRARVGVDSFYKTCARWGRAYNDALLAVEANAHGAAVLLGLKEGVRYPNLFKDTGQTRLNPSETEKLGWQTTALSRPVLLDHLLMAVCGDSEADAEHFEPEFHVRDKVFLQECLAFTEKDGRYEAGAGSHDDTIFAWGIALQAYAQLKARDAIWKMPNYGITACAMSEAERLFPGGSAAETFGPLPERPW